MINHSLHIYTYVIYGEIYYYITIIIIMVNINSLKRYLESTIKRNEFFIAWSIHFEGNVMKHKKQNPRNHELPSLEDLGAAT